MKSKWKIWKTRLSGTDVFQKTQTTLTIQYSFVLISFLLLFVLTVYGLLYYLLINDQKQQLSNALQQKIYALHEEGNYTQDPDQSDDSEATQVKEILLTDTYQLGSVFVNANGVILSGDSIYSDILLNTIQSNNLLIIPKDNTIHYADIDTKARLTDKSLERKELDNNDFQKKESTSLSDVKMIVAIQKVALSNQTYGTLYLAKNVTVEYRVFQSLLIILISIAIIFCIIAVFLSSRMSTRAMIPISTSYQRQREFVADASHELRTPLSVILSSIDTLEMEDKIEEDEFLQKILHNMKDEAKRMIELSSRLLTLARTDSDTIQLQLSTFNLYTDAHKIIQSMQPLAHHKEIKLSLQSPESIYIHGDADQIKQLLVILLDNAIKYTPSQGNVKLELKLYQTKSNILQIKVHDDGIGIASEEQTRIFERFYRVDKSRTRQISGHGLGLSIAKWIVQAHGGTLTVSSQPGQGSLFTAEIPC